MKKQTPYIIIRGPLGIGKSTISKLLAKKLKAQYFSIDKTLEKSGLEQDSEEGYPSQRSYKKVNEILIPKAKYFLKKDVPVIFDGNFYWKSQIEDLRNKLKYPNYIFTIKAPLLLCIKRDKARKKSAGKDAVEAVYRKSTEFDYGINVNTNKKTPEEVTKEILSYLK